MRSKLFALALGLSLLSLSSAGAQVVSGLLRVTGAEMG